MSRQIIHSSTVYRQFAPAMGEEAPGIGVVTSESIPTLEEDPIFPQSPSPLIGSSASSSSIFQFSCQKPAYKRESISQLLAVSSTETAMPC